MAVHAASTHTQYASSNLSTTLGANNDCVSFEHASSFQNNNAAAMKQQDGAPLKRNKCF